jgi:hypothetical protein
MNPFTALGPRPVADAPVIAILSNIRSRQEMVLHCGDIGDADMIRLFPACANDDHLAHIKRRSDSERSRSFCSAIACVISN